MIQKFIYIQNLGFTLPENPKEEIIIIFFEGMPIPDIYGELEIQCKKYSTNSITFSFDGHFRNNLFYVEYSPEIMENHLRLKQLLEQIEKDLK